MSGGPFPITSPWAYVSPDYAGNVISVTVTFDNTQLTTDNTLLPLLSVTVHRDPACVYRKLYFGIGPDGTPDTVTRHINNVPAGDTVLPLGPLANAGISTLADVLGVQVTAGP